MSIHYNNYTLWTTGTQMGSFKIQGASGTAEKVREEKPERGHGRSHLIVDCGLL